MAITLCLAAGLPLDVRADSASPALPFAAQVESVLERGAIEGRAVSVARFRSPLGADAVLAETRRAWATGGSGPLVESVSGWWRILSRYDESGYVTLQVRPHVAGGSEGLLSTWRSTPVANGWQLDPLSVLPPGAAVLRRVSSADAGRHAETVVALAEAGVATAASSMHDRLTLAGYRRDPIVRTPATQDASGTAYMYRRGAREVAVTLHPYQGRTGIVMHVTEGTR